MDGGLPKQSVQLIILLLTVNELVGGQGLPAVGSGHPLW